MFIFPILLKHVEETDFHPSFLFITTPGSTFKTTCLAVPTRIFPLRIYFKGGRVVRWCWVNFHCRGVLLIWVRVGQRPTSLPVGAIGCCWAFFLSSIISLFFLSLFLCLGWMDDMRFYVHLNSISVISGRCSDDNERLGAMELRLRFPLGDGPIQTEILSERAVKPKNNQPPNTNTFTSTCMVFYVFALII